MLLSDSNIQLANNNLYNDTPKVINAFFYSNKTLEIYGVGSNIKIVGGIYGNQIILNAVKRKSSDSPFSNSFSVTYSERSGFSRTIVIIIFKTIEPALTQLIQDFQLFIRKT